MRDGIISQCLYFLRTSLTSITKTLTVPRRIFLTICIYGNNPLAMQIKNFWLYLPIARVNMRNINIILAELAELSLVSESDKRHFEFLIKLLPTRNYNALLSHLEKATEKFINTSDYK